MVSPVSAVSAEEPRSFVDPFGFRHELVAALDHGAPFTPGRPMAGFVTGAQGLGHVVLLVPDLDDAERFFTATLGLRPTDTVEGGGFDLRFFHCAGSAARHHTLAFAAVPGRGRPPPPHAGGDHRSTTSAPRST